MRGEEAFEDTAFLGIAKRAKRDPYRLGLFAAHLDSDERPLVFLAVQGGTLIVTDRRVLEFGAHLEVHGAWNVKEFQGYEVRRSLERSHVRSVEHVVAHAVSGPAGTIEDSVLVHLPDRDEAIVVSRGPQPTLSGEDFVILSAAIFGQPK